MLRKTACEEGKDWDKLSPYVVFTYREVPQESTEYSPFELLYGREVCGPLDVIKETWESPTILSYMTSMKEKFKQMEDLVQANMEKVQSYQKQWYDKSARERHFVPGDQVLILLPTTSITHR